MRPQRFAAEYSTPANHCLMRNLHSSLRAVSVFALQTGVVYRILRLRANKIAILLKNLRYRERFPDWEAAQQRSRRHGEQNHTITASRMIG